MHDYAATFYGGYDQVVVRRVARVRVSWIVVAIAVAAAVLVLLVTADVAAYAGAPPLVRVTQVGWYAEGYLLVSGGGFTVRGGASAELPLTCSSFCLPWTGASVNAPFAVTGFSVVDRAVQYVNVTVRAPSGAYDGPLAISLGVPEL